MTNSRYCISEIAFKSDPNTQLNHPSEWLFPRILVHFHCVFKRFPIADSGNRKCHLVTMKITISGGQKTQKSQKCPPGRPGIVWCAGGVCTGDSVGGEWGGGGVKLTVQWTSSSSKLLLLPSNVTSYLLG